MHETTELGRACEHAERRREIGRDLLVARRDVAQFDLHIKQIEMGIRAGIVAETTEEGKPLFSNDVKRDAEFIARAGGNAALGKLKTDRDEREFQAGMMALDTQFHADMVRILCAFAEASQEQNDGQNGRHTAANL